MAAEVEKAATAHAQTPEGAPWREALYLWAGDLNLTCHRVLDNETPRPTPPPEVMSALNGLNVVMGGAVDVYRALNPRGQTYTHGTVEKGVTKPGSRRRLDAWMAPPDALSGPTGVVSTRLLDKEGASFSYVHSHNRREIYKESDHDGVQIVLRGALIPKPEARATLKLSTLRDPGVRAALSGLLAETGDLTVATADALWNQVMQIGIEHQRAQAKARGAQRQEILKKIKRLQAKLKGMPEGRGYNRVTSTLNRYKSKLRLRIHKDRRQRDDLEEYTNQMTATGHGKQPKPWAPPQPITRVQEPATCRIQAALKPASQGRVQLTLSKVVTEGAVHTSQEDIAASLLSGRICSTPFTRRRSRLSGTKPESSAGSGPRFARYRKPLLKDCKQPT